MVRYYRTGNAYLEDADEDATAAAEAEIEAIMQGLEDGDEEVYERVQTVVDRVLEGMTETLERLPVHFDEFVKETRFMRDGSTDDVVARLQDLDEASYDEDAWQLDLSAFGLDKEFVFLRSDGTTLYTTRDVAHHEWKFANFDRAITVIGEDHQLTFEQLNCTLELLGHDTDQLDQVFYSWVNLPGGEGMSTREGTGIDLDEAVDRAREEVENRMGDRVRDDDLTEADVERIARQVGIGAVRYDIVAKQPSKAITFEWDRALDFEAQSAPYVQYVHARACGIIGEARDADVEPADEIDPALLDTPEERDLLRTIARFPAVVEEAAADLQPHTVATYTREFAEGFNAFYRECPVLDADEDRRRARLALVGAARTTVANALDLLGVEAPESM
jgi:arginyl-tRNA synthetase